jgi:hypothetical protein
VTAMVATLLPEFDQTSHFIRRWSRCAKVGHGAGRGWLGLLPLAGWGLCGGARWVDIDGGLPVTLAHFGIRTRKLAWRWDLDPRVAQCALSTTVSIPGLVPADRDPRAAHVLSARAWEAR